VDVPQQPLTVPSFVTPSPLANSPTESLPGAPNVPVGPPVSTGGLGAPGESSPGGTGVAPSSPTMSAPVPGGAAPAAGASAPGATPSPNSSSGY
jgi:hypothetical protein